MNQTLSTPNVPMPGAPSTPEIDPAPSDKPESNPSKPIPEIEHPVPETKPEIEHSHQNLPEISPPDVKPESMPSPQSPEIITPSPDIKDIKTIVAEEARQADA